MSRPNRSPRSEKAKSHSHAEKRDLVAAALVGEPSASLRCALPAPGQGTGEGNDIGTSSVTSTFHRSPHGWGLHAEMAQPSHFRSHVDRCRKRVRSWFRLPLSGCRARFSGVWHQFRHHNGPTRSQLPDRARARCIELVQVVERAVRLSVIDDLLWRREFLPDHRGSPSTTWIGSDVQASPNSSSTAYVPSSAARNWMTRASVAPAR